MAKNLVKGGLLSLLILCLAGCSGYRPVDLPATKSAPPDVPGPPVSAHEPYGSDPNRK